MGFEEFIQSHGSDRNKLQLRCTPYTSKKGGYGSFDLDFGLCVYKHQQSKVDGLQKRVDACQKILGKWKATGMKGTSDYAVGGAHTRKNCEEELEQALKGDSND